MSKHFQHDVLVIGSGAAGLGVVLRLDPKLRVAVIAKGPLTEGSSRYAQGGISAVLAPEDSVDAHVEDTLNAGAGLCDPDVVQFVAKHGAEQIHWLEQLGMRFTAANNGTKATPCLQADLLGDWREEVVLRSADDFELRIYTTSTITDQRIPTLMHDPQYRTAVAQQNSGYNQPPHPSFFIGNNMPAAPTPKVFVDPVPKLVGLEKSEEGGDYVTPVMVYLTVNQGEWLQNAYQIDDEGWTPYWKPFVVKGRGVHTVRFRTTDAAGNLLAEATRTLTIS